MFDIINNMVVEISNVKQKQNVLYMLFQQQSVAPVVAPPEPNVVLSTHVTNEPYGVFEDETATDNDDDDVETDADDNNADDADTTSANENTDKTDNIYADFTTPTTIHKIKVSNDEFDTDNDDIFVSRHEFPAELFERFESTNNHLIDIDFRMLNLFPEMIQHLDGRQTEETAEIHILNGEDNMNGFLDVETLNEFEPEPAGVQLPEPEQEPEQITAPEQEPEPEPAENTATAIQADNEDTISIMSEKSINIFFNAEKDKYKKMNIQALKALVANRGICQDPSKLKKGEILKLLMANVSS
jgi:hypothetical protein